MSGAAVTVASQGFQFVLRLISGIVLARLLTPSDFGLLAMVASYMALAEMAQNLGLNYATIYREQISQAQMSAIFWLSVGFNIMLAITVIASAPLLAWFFRDTRLVALTIAFGFLFFINGFQSQPSAILNREFRIKALAAIDMLTATVRTVVGITVAWLTSSYWALFAASLASSLVGLMINWTMCRFRPSRPSFEGKFREIVGFGSGISAFNIVNYFARNADNLLIGRFYGAQQLGFYDRAYQLLLLPLSQVYWPLGRLMLPLLSRLQSDSEQYRKTFIEIISVLMTITQPGLIFMIVFAEDVFLLLLGQQWAPAVPIFRWLGVAGLAQTLGSTIGYLFMSQGRGGDYFKIGTLNATVTVAAFLIGLPWGAIGVAIAYCIANYVVILPSTCWSVGRSGPISTRGLFLTALPHAVAVVGTGSVLVGLSYAIASPGLLGCLGLIVVSYAVYGLVILSFPAKRLIFQKNLRASLALY